MFTEIWAVVIIMLLLGVCFYIFYRVGKTEGRVLKLKGSLDKLKETRKMEKEVDEEVERQVGQGGTDPVSGAWFVDRRARK